MACFAPRDDGPGSSGQGRILTLAGAAAFSTCRRVSTGLGQARVEPLADCRGVFLVVAMAMKDETEAASVDANARIVRAVTSLVQPILAATGVELDRIECNRAGRGALLQVFIDKAGGVCIDDCTNVSRQLSALLDHADHMPESYTLEVSSPGLTRPLKGAADFQRYTGRLAYLHCRVPVVGGDYKVTGILRGMVGDDVVVEVPGTGARVRVPLDKVKKARLEIES